MPCKRVNPLCGLLKAIAVYIVILMMALAGCAKLPKDFHRPVSLSLPEPHLNELGRHVEADVLANPGKSGFHLLVDNFDALVARGMLAQVAEKTLDLQYYIFKGDEAGFLVLSWVIDAAERGVRVRILVDDLGTAGKDSNMALMSSHPNIQVRVFNPLAQRSGVRTDLLFDLGRVERRMHNKSFIVDNSAAIIGGRNIGNEYYTVPGGRTFFDLDVLTVGPVVQDISASFDAFWNSEQAYPVEALFSGGHGDDDLELMREELERERSALQASSYFKAITNSDLFQRVTSRNLTFLWADSDFLYDRPGKVSASLDDESEHIAPEFRAHFENIESEFVMVSPYFVPTESGVAYLGALREKGVAVKVMTNSLATNDVWIVHSGYAPYRKDLLSSGVELFEMKASAFKDYRDELREFVEVDELRLHIKALVIDKRYVIMGSSNFDPRSIVYNTEVGLVIDSPELAKKMLQGFAVMTAPENSFRLYLVDDEDDSGRIRKKVRWETIEDGEIVVYRDEPGAGFWRKFGAWFMRAFPIEGKL